MLLFDAVHVGLALQIVILFTLPIEYLASRNVKQALRLLAAEVTVAGLATFGLGQAWSVRHDVVGAVLAAGAVTLLAANVDELTNTHRPNRSWPHLIGRSPQSAED